MHAAEGAVLEVHPEAVRAEVMATPRGGHPTGASGVAATVQTLPGEGEEDIFRAAPHHNHQQMHFPTLLHPLNTNTIQMHRP